MATLGTSWNHTILARLRAHLPDLAFWVLSFLFVCTVQRATSFYNIGPHITINRRLFLFSMMMTKKKTVSDELLTNRRRTFAVDLCFLQRSQ
jgi:hypothetical protein